jgi:DNA-binding NtrC family response regulator
MDNEPDHIDVFLVAAATNERRLLLGELLDAGYDVGTAPGFEQALGRLLQHDVEPRVVLMVVQNDPHATPGSVQFLMASIPNTPILLIVGAPDRSLWKPLATNGAELFHRPIRIGKVVEAVQSTLNRISKNAARSREKSDGTQDREV